MSSRLVPVGLPAFVFNVGGGTAVQLVEVDHARGILRGASDPRPGGLALGSWSRRGNAEVGGR